MASNKYIEPNQQTPSEEEILKYLHNNLSHDEMHELEMQMIQSSFVNDAVEGLQAFHKKESIQKITQDLNNIIEKETKKKAKRKKYYEKFMQQNWLQLIVLVVLLVCLLAFFMVRYFILHT